MLHVFNGAEFDAGFKRDMATHWALDLDSIQKGWTQLASNSLGPHTILNGMAI